VSRIDAIVNYGLSSQSFIRCIYGGLFSDSDSDEHRSIARMGGGGSKLSDEVNVISFLERMYCS
jgi:hypothetical protein